MRCFVPLVNDAWIGIGRLYPIDESDCIRDDVGDVRRIVTWGRHSGRGQQSEKGFLVTI